MIGINNVPSPDLPAACYATRSEEIASVRY